MARSRARRRVTPRISFRPWTFLLLSYTRPTITLCFVLIYTVSYTCFFTRTDSSIHQMHKLFSHSCRNIVLFHLHFLEISKVVLFMYIIEVTICMVQSLINFVCVSDNWNQSCKRLLLKMKLDCRNFTSLDVFCSTRLYFKSSTAGGLVLASLEMVANFLRTLQGYIMDFEIGSLFWGCFLQFFSYNSVFK